jgi:Ni,Fe-hydrogenase I large subunit
MQDDNKNGENNGSVYTGYTVNTNAENNTGEPDEIVLVSFKRSKKIHKAAATFAFLSGLTHSQMVDKAEAEYMKNHAKEVPIAFNVGEVDIRPKVTPEMAAANQAELTEIKQTLNKYIEFVNHIVSSNNVHSIESDNLEEWRQKLSKKLASTRRFLKATKLQDPNLLRLINEAGKALDASGTSQKKIRQQKLGSKGVGAGEDS